jgi:serine/threonine-protein kinase
MSPEQVRGMPLDRRSDVFSVGVVLFEMLTGTRLFQADTDFATLEKVRAVEVPRPSSLNPEIAKPLENIMYKALAREPEQRYQSSIELHDELQAFMFAQGLFYSRKDLAAWMRQQYAREIELEKEKDKIQAAVRPETLEQQAPPRRQRKTMMMSPGGGPPPPPSRGRPPPPPPSSRPSSRPASRPNHAAQPQSTPAGAPPSPPRRSKRKTMVMTTARPNLPLPPGGGRSRNRHLHDEPPTVPIAQAMPRPVSMPANPKPRSKPASTMSYAAASAPPATDFDWDDDELETRLFEGEESATTSPPPARSLSAPRTPRDENDQLGGAIATPPANDAPASANDAGNGYANRSVTIIPGQQILPPMMGTPSGKTVVPGQAHGGHPPQGMYPQYPSPVGQSPQYGHAGGHAMAMHAGPLGAGPGMGPGMGAGIGSGHQGVPLPPMVDYGERSNKSSAGPIIGILIAVIVLLVAGFAGYLVVRDQQGLGSVISSADAPSTADPVEPTKASELAAAPAEAAATKAALTVQTTPTNASVRVDGQAVAGESPFVVSGLDPGKHEILVSKDGYLPVERQVEVPAGGLAVPLILERKEVTLVLRTEPPEAALTLFADSSKPIPMGKGGGGQYRLSREPGTRYQVEATLEGYVSRREPLEFSGDGTETISVTLVRDGSAVLAAKAETGKSGNDTSGATKTPRKTPRRRGSGSSSSSSSGTATTPKSEPKPKPEPKSTAKSSTLRVGTNPGVPPASIYVDGQFVGKTPLTGVNVTPGRHTVKFKWPSGKEIKKTVNVADNGSEVVKAG